MLLFQSIIIYTLFGLAMFALAKRRVALIIPSGQSRDRRVQIGFLYCVLLFALMSGMRWGVGKDYFSYLEGYQNAMRTGGANLINRESLFAWFEILLANHGVHFSVFFGLCALFQMLFIALAFKDDEYVFPFVALLCVLGEYYMSWMNGIRQCIAMCMFVWMVKYIQEKKPVHYLVWVFVAFSIHKSALLVVPLYLLTFLKHNWTNRAVLYGVLAISVIVGELPFVGSYLNKTVPILELLGYDGYADKFDVFADSLREMAWGPIKISKLIVQIAVIGFYPKIYEYFNKPIMKHYFKLFFVGSCMYYILANTSYLFLRPIMYLTIFSLPMIAFTLSYLWQNRNRYNIIFWILLFLTFVPLFWVCIKGSRNPENSYVLFEFFFSPNRSFPH